MIISSNAKAIEQTHGDIPEKYSIQTIYSKRERERGERERERRERREREREREIDQR